jgi:hypothetical protein
MSLIGEQITCMRKDTGVNTLTVGQSYTILEVIPHSVAAFFLYRVINDEGMEHLYFAWRFRLESPFEISERLIKQEIGL